MNAAALAYRFRVVIFVALYLLGFLPPWGANIRGGSDGTLWLAASTLSARGGWISLATATLTVTLISLACLAMGTMLRVWGTAYLGSSVMRGAVMKGEQLVVAGPYRHVRNPLYLGAWLLACGASILMPPGGAAFFLPAFSMFVLFLISREERFLSARLGEVYQQYRRRVPRLLPRLEQFRNYCALIKIARCGFPWKKTTKRPAVSVYTHCETALSPQPGAGDILRSVRPHWLEALLAETYPIAFTLCFAIFAWRYNARILIQCLLICYGCSLVIRALIKAPIAPANAGAGA
jgi:protein-S-isoprenylcysteine O-methyltransferase Ste14